MSNRTWACVDCGKTFRRDSSVEEFKCPECGDPCEYIHWKIHVPSPKRQAKWRKFWNKYREEKAILDRWHAGELHDTDVVHLEILNMGLMPRR